MSFRKPVNTNLTQAFGADFQLNGKWYYKSMGYNGHNGLDYAAPIGTPVYAADDGTVVFEGWGQKHGWMGTPAGICILMHHGQSYSAYAHLSSTEVNQGQWVTKGTKIGYVGNTGAATGAHLHFEMLPLNPVFSNGYAGRIDPTPYMDAPKNTATHEQIYQAYREILGRDADDAGLKHYLNFAIDFVRSDLASSQEYRDRQARLEREARERAEQQAREAERIKSEQLRQEAERKAKEEADARAAAIAEAERLKAEQAAQKPVDTNPLDDPFNIPGRGSVTNPSTTPAPTKPADPTVTVTPKQNPIARFIFTLLLKLLTKK